MFRHYLKIAIRSLTKRWGFNLTALVALIMGTVLFAMLFYATEHERFFRTGSTARERSCYPRYTERGEFDDGEMTRVDSLIMHGSNWTENSFRYEDPDIEMIVGSSGTSLHIAGSRDARLFLTYASGKVTEIREKALNVSSSFFEYKGMSMLYGDRLPEHENEIVVTEAFIRKHTLDDFTNVTLSIAPTDSLDYRSILFSSQRFGTDPLYIVNVIKDDKWSRCQDADVYFNKNFFDDIILVLKKGADIDAVNSRLAMNKWEKHELQFYYGRPYTKHFYTPYLSKVNQADARTRIWRLLLSVILLFTGVVCFLVSLVDRFINQRQSNRIRLSLGAGKTGLFMGQMMQVLVMMTVVLAVSAVVTVYLVAFVNHAGLYPHPFSSVGRLYFHLPDILLLEVWVILTVFIAGCLILAVTVLLYKPATSVKTGLTHRERHIMRNILIGLEVSLSVCACFCLTGYVSGRHRLYNPLPSGKLKRTYIVNLSNSRYDFTRGLMMDRIKRLPFIEDAVATGTPQTTSHDEIGVISVSLNTTGYEGNNFQYVIFSDSTYFRFFNIPVTYHNAVGGEKKVYLSQNLIDRIEATGRKTDPFYQLYEHDLMNLMMQGKMPESEKEEDYYALFEKYTVAGVFQNRFGDVSTPHDYNDSYVLLTDDRYPCKYLYIRLRQGTDVAQARHEIEKICMDYVDLSVPELITQIGDRWLDSSGNSRIYMLLAFMASVAGVFMVVLSITSAISTDTGRRRKEVALRKVHGAKASDIARLFILPYAVITVIAFAAGWLLASVISDLVSSVLWIRIQPWHGIIVFIFIVTVISLSTFWKVRGIMRTNPADVIKSE